MSSPAPPVLKNLAKKSGGDDFIWGVATASYQIEGGFNADGRGRGNWDVFCQRPGNVYEGDTGNVACDHYHRLDEDLDLLSGLGVGAYRFGISWPRVIPEGTGAPNEKGLAFYDRLIDGLLERKITPYATLFHWDYPQALEERGGWRHRDSPEWFAEMTQLLVSRFGDRVRHWFTLNEPHAYIEGGLRHGRHAPGYTLPLKEVLLAGHHTLLAHGKSVQILRSEVKDSWVAMAPVLVCATPATNSAEDIEAARRHTFGMPDDVVRRSTWWMDPCFGLGFPEDGLRQFGDAVPPITAADLETIHQPLDAVGFNLYDTVVVQAGADGEPIEVPWPVGGPRTAFNWPVTPEGHYWGPKFAYERYQKPVVITENGLSCRDRVHLDGTCKDAQRVDFIDRHLIELDRAAAEVPVAGYFHWSLMDNFEWNHGYRERFGLIHVDYETLKRTPKASYYHYRDLIRRQ